MKALISHRPGGPETLVLEEVPDPVPKTGEVLLRVEAVGVNFPDGLFIRDLYQLKLARPFSPGGELCGVVEALGPQATGLAVGDRVIARSGWGAMAQRIALPVDRCVPIPADAPAEEAAALLYTYATAYHALHDAGGLRGGESLLVLGAAGGVGSAAMDLGRAFGARVFAAVSSPEKLAFAREHGALDGVVYPREIPDREAGRALAAQFKALVGSGGADLVFDPVGGPYAEAAVRALAPYGRHLVVGFTAGIPKLPLNLVLLKTARIVGVDWRAFGENEPEANARNIAAVIALWREGRIRPVVSACLPLERGGEAIARLESRQVLGKLVVRVS